MDGKNFFRSSVTPPPIPEFVFDLQRFDLSETKGDGAVFEAVIDNKTYYGTAADFKTGEEPDSSNLGNATTITLLKDLTTNAGNAGNTNTNPTPVLTLSKSCTLDLNGHTLTFDKPIGIQIANGTDANKKNTFTLQDSNTAKTGKIVDTWDPNNDDTKARSSKKGTDTYIQSIKSNRIYAAIQVGTCVYATDSEFTEAGGKNNDLSGNTAPDSNAVFVMDGGTIESKSSAICGSDGCEITIKNNSKVQSINSSGIYFGHRGNGGSTVTIQDNATIISGSDLIEIENAELLNDDEYTAALNAKLKELYNTTFKDDTSKEQIGADTTISDAQKKDLYQAIYSEMPAIQVGGMLTNNATTITIKDNSKVQYTKPEPDMKENNGGPEGDPTAIYASGKVDLNISGGEITSTGTGVEIRAGELNFTGGTVTSTATNYYLAKKKGSGATTFGAAISMCQHTTNQNIEVKVSGNAKAEAPIAFTVENAEDNKATDKTIKAVITGGTFESTSTDVAAIAAKTSDSRSTIEVGNATFIGNLESTFASTNESNSAGIIITAPVTVETIVVDEEGNVVTDENGNRVTKSTTYDSTSFTFTEKDSEGKDVTYPVNEGWNQSQPYPDKFYYLIKKTTEGTSNYNAESKATLAGDAATTTLELKTAESSGLETLAVNLNDTAFSGLGEAFKTLDASNGTNNVAFNITGNAQVTSILGGKGGDTLKAGANGAALNGGKGDDLLIGGDGNDTFIFESGNGSDSIQGFGTGDIVSLGSGLTPATSFNNGVSYDGTDYVVKLGSTDGDSLTFKSPSTFSITDGNATYTYAPSSIVSGDGVTIGGTYSSKTFNGASDANDTFKTIDASAINYAIRITGNDNANKIVGGTGGGTLLGGDNADTLVASSVGTFLNGGDGADSLVGYDSGGNTFIYTAGDDKIKNYVQDQDLVSVVSGISIADATVDTKAGTDSATDLVIGFDSGNSLTFEGGGGSTISLQSGRNNYYNFSASSIALDKSITLTANYTPASGEVFNNDSAYDTVDASKVTSGITIAGTDENNYIAIGTSGGSISGGEKGNDTLVGGIDADIFRYTAGNDVIVDFDSTKDKLDIDTPETKITKARASSRRLTFTMNDKSNLVFRSNDSIPAVISLTSNAYLTADGVVSLPATGTKSLKLFSSAKGRIDLREDPYSAASIKSVDASTIKSQSVTLVGSSLGGSFTFAENNKKRDGFEYNGGAVTISNYESGKDRINLNDYSIAAFSVTGSGGTANDVFISLSGGTGTGNTISLTSAKDSEVLIHQSTNKGNSYSKMVFDASGVMYDKVPSKATSATLWSGAGKDNGNLYSATAANKLKKITVKDSSVSGISIRAGNNNTVIDASLAGAGISLVSGNKNDKFTGSATNPDTFIYTAGKDIIQDFVATSDLISLNGASEDITLSSAKITAGKKSVKFKFGNKNVLTVKGKDLNTTAISVNGAAQTFGKNSIADSSGSNVSLTSQFGGTYNTKNSKATYVDGKLVSKKLTFKGTEAAESLIGGSNKTLFKGGGGADSLVGGSGADTFFYAKGDTGTATIANFDFSKDKLKIAGGTISKVSSIEGGGVQFAMKKDKGTDAAAVGWFDVKSFTKDNVAVTDASKVAIKANNTYYWFAEGGEILASDETSTVAAGALITSISKVSNSQVSGYEVIELNYATNLVKSNVAVQVTKTKPGNT